MAHVLGKQKQTTSKRCRYVHVLFSTSHASIHSLYTSTASLSLWIFAEKRSLQVLHTTLPTCAASDNQQEECGRLSTAVCNSQHPSPLRHSPALPSRFCWSCRMGS